MVTTIRHARIVRIVEDVAARDYISRREIVVNARGVIVLFAEHARGRVDEVVRALRSVGQRHELQEGLNLRAERAFRYDVIDDADIERVFQHNRFALTVYQLAEIAVAHLGRRHNAQAGRVGTDLPSTLPVEEEERLAGAVVKPWHAHRPAYIRAELIAIQARGLLALFADRVVGLGQRIVAIELPQRRVQFIAAPPGDDIDLPAGRAAVLG